MQAFKLNPAYKDNLWGGERLRTLYHKQTDLAPLAESWELSAHPDGPATLAPTGQSFADFIRQNPAAVGAGFAPGDEFPLLIKLIDAAQPLSLQVHPGDAWARAHENSPGKTEMWVVLDAAPDSFLYLGFAAAITPEVFARHIAQGTLPQALHKQPVAPGEVYYIPAGTVHAIGAGVLVAEVQQSSNITYRVDDFGRLGPDGKPRPLHIRQARAVANFGPAAPAPPGAGTLGETSAYTHRRLALCPYFEVQHLALRGRFAGACGPESFTALLCTAGAARLTNGGETLPLEAGETLFIPAGSGTYTLEGEAQLLLARLGQKEE